MIRPPLKNYKDNDILCQIIDWRSYDIFEKNIVETSGYRTGY